MLTRSVKLWLSLQSLSFLSVLATRDVTIKATDYARITYTPATNWVHADSTSPCGGTFMFSNINSASLTIQFTGIAVSVGLLRFPSGARASIEIDGVEQAVVDTQISKADCYTPPFIKANLTDTQHTLRITDASNSFPSRWLRFNSLTYTEYTPEERPVAPPTISVATVYTASFASVSPGLPTSAITGPEPSARVEKKANIAQIAGGIGGGVLGLALILGLVWLILRRNRTGRPRSAVHSQDAQMENAEKSETTPYQPPDQPYNPRIVTSSSTANFAAHPAGSIPYHNFGATTTNVPTNGPSSNPPQSFQPPYTDRSMPQYNPQEAQNMASMVADMVAARIQNPTTPQGPLPEPMDITSTGRQASPINARNSGRAVDPFS